MKPRDLFFIPSAHKRVVLRSSLVFIPFVLLTLLLASCSVTVIEGPGVDGPRTYVHRFSGQVIDPYNRPVVGLPVMMNVWPEGRRGEGRWIYYATNKSGNFYFSIESGHEGIIYINDYPARPRPGAPKYKNNYFFVPVTFNFYAPPGEGERLMIEFKDQQRRGVSKSRAVPFPLLMSPMGVSYENVKDLYARGNYAKANKAGKAYLKKYSRYEGAMVDEVTRFIDDAGARVAERKQSKREAMEERTAERERVKLDREERRKEMERIRKEREEERVREVEDWKQEERQLREKERAVKRRNYEIKKLEEKQRQKEQADAQVDEAGAAAAATAEALRKAKEASRPEVAKVVAPVEEPPQKTEKLPRGCKALITQADFLAAPDVKKLKDRCFEVDAAFVEKKPSNGGLYRVGAAFVYISYSKDFKGGDYRGMVKVAGKTRRVVEGKRKMVPHLKIVR